MDLDKIKAKGATVILLGAGATRGASFTKAEFFCGPYPPLDADFFTQLQRVRKNLSIKDVKKLINYVVNEFGTGFSLSMEAFFSKVEIASEMCQKLPFGKGRPATLVKPEKLFKRALVALFNESTRARLCTK